MKNAGRPARLARKRDAATVADVWFQRRLRLTLAKGYRGTPLWQEYTRRGLVSDAMEGYKYVNCSEIDPICQPGEVINRLRQAGLKKLFLYQLSRYPLQTLKRLRRFLPYMPLRDVAYLIIKPFLGQEKGATKAER
jgi:anaerobic magnesium-protoporphyrin IX monomethyl ester cyclase